MHMSFNMDITSDMKCLVSGKSIESRPRQQIQTKSNHDLSQLQRKRKERPPGSEEEYVVHRRSASSEERAASDPLAMAVAAGGDFDGGGGGSNVDLENPVAAAVEGEPDIGEALGATIISHPAQKLPYYTAHD